jgi:hypothetical protein
METQCKCHQNRNNLFSKRRPMIPRSLHFQNSAIPWTTSVKYLGLLIDSKLLFTKHLQATLHKATGIFHKIFPLLACDSALSVPNKLLLFKSLLRPIITYAAPIWSSTSLTNYRRLQVFQSKCLRVIGNLPRRTPIPQLHANLHIIPISQFI